MSGADGGRAILSGRWWKENWALGIFLVDVGASLLMLLKWGATGHYVNFTAPATYLWGQRDAYGTGFPGSPGAFFYSPSAALFYFGFFNLFPPRLGQLLYMASSVAVFWAGFMALFGSLQRAVGFDLRTSPYRHLFWLMAGSEITGGIVAVKIDVLIVGVLAWAASRVLDRRSLVAAFFAVGLVTSWKLHPFSIVGLLLVVLVVLDFRQAVSAGLSFAAGLALGFASPFLVLPSEFVLQVTRHWMSSLSEFIAVAWLDRIFQHLYGFVARTFHVGIDLRLANRLTAVLGALLAGFLLWASREAGRRLPRDEARAFLVVAALGLGSGFIAMFSQLVQSNSYILYLPLPLAAIVLCTRNGYPRKPLLWCLGVCWFTISLAYSDLCPRPLRSLLFDSGVKPVGVLVLFVLTVVALRRLVRSREPRVVPAGGTLMEQPA